ncbi:MAG: coagulation factor 5/8 type domain protein [Actinomycetia bacterium]|nr:coagulation factor 5/8 type domain protein [Actinomycetes bacterium]
MFSLTRRSRQVRAPRDWVLALTGTARLPRCRRVGPRAYATAVAVAFVALGLVNVPSQIAAAAAQPASSYQPPGTPPPSVAGATTPFSTYQAPEGSLGGGASVVSLTSAPASQFDSPQGEATGHAYVQLTGTGQSVQWTNNTGQPISFINVRASIPDSSGGGGITATLDLYVNGVFRQALNLNSIQSWLYQGAGNLPNDSQSPSVGNPRDFWDEFHAFVSGAPIPAGATFSLQKDSSNTASFYWINSIDLWNAPAPAAQPANSISITSCGAVADNTPTNGAAAPGAQDSTADIQNCINQAASQGKILWIPQGTFYMIGTSSLVVNNVTVEGAGYWYSEIYRDIPLPNSTALGSALQCTSCHLENFHIDSNSPSRATSDGGGGAEDTGGTNWVIEGMWVQHVESSVWASGTGGIVENNFFTDIWADGCNLNNVSLGASSGSNLTSTNNFIRGTGDDGMAINSVDYNGSQTYTAMSNITMSHNTVLAAWNAHGIGVYGGSGEVVSDNYIADTSSQVGLGVGRFGSNGSDLLSATISGNVIVRAGGNAYNQGQPAMMIGNVGNGTSTIPGATGTVTNVTATDNTIIQPVYDGIGFSSATNVVLADNKVINPWRNGIVIAPLYYPSPTGNATITRNYVSGVSSGHSAFSNTASGFTASLSGNSWQNGTSEGTYGGLAAAVPGTVQAANYDTGGQGVAYNVTSVNGSANSYRPDGVNLEACTDTTSSGCGYDLGWTSPGQWFRYTVNAASAGIYTVSFRVSSPGGVSGAFHIADTSGDDLTGAESVPATGGYQTWTTVTDTITLPAGQQTLVVDQDNGGWNMRYLSFAATAVSPEGPYPGPAAAAVPGTVQAENYDTGGQGAAYNVTSANGSANSYRPDGVDLEATSDTGGGYDLGWTATGQWFRYTVNVAAAGTYTLGLRVAAPAAVTDALHIASSSGASLSGNVNVPATGGYQAWTTVDVTVTLPAGVQTLTVDQDNGGWNVNYLSFAAAGISTSAWYEARNVNSGLCASAAGGGTANGTAVQQLACTGASSQLWQFVPAASGYYEVLNQNAQSEGESWNVTGGVGATAAGDLLQTWNYGGPGNTNALFAADQLSGGYYNFVADNSGLCIDIPGASTASGVQLQQHTCNGTSAQQFNLVQPS